MDSLQQTGNNLKDIISWVKSGHIVTLKAGFKTLTYHNKCGSGSLLYSDKVINVDVGSYASLLNEGEWPWYFDDEGCRICSCKIGKKLVCSINIKLGY
uniref:Uncharacterized protein n=1 Tax=Pithovirus LCPAC401 TaxID=2506595 RepID=A0A481ZCV5_9VIRU|nr:MAG: hypothetical protein LCPAC401_01390 [Pithovirus LCPAC401]